MTSGRDQRMNQRAQSTGRSSQRKGRRRLTRRGVVSILAMMMLVLFGSLSVAMAIASQGNLRTAATHLHVLRAMGAAETGMGVAESRLQHAVNRFIVEKGEVTSSFAGGLWTGSVTGAGRVDVLPLDNGYIPAGIADALINMHSQDENTVVVGSISSPSVGTAPTGVTPGVYMSTNWIMTPAVGLNVQPGSPGSTPEASAVGSAFQITYAPLADGIHVRVIVTGYDFDYLQAGRSMKRTIMQDYQIVKRIDQAVLSPSRIMVGKNVLVNGDLGTTFDSLTFANAEPSVLKSDFENLDPGLDTMIGNLQQNLAVYDTDSDNRLRIGHPIEGEGVGFDSDGDGNPNFFFPDVTEDGMVDEFDLFLDHFDTNGDGMVALSDALRLGTPNQALSAEFVTGTGDPLDDELALLIDRANPDRNRNGISGFRDDNNNGKWDPGEPFNDIDVNTGLAQDHILGYRDGVIDRRDLYAKINGRLQFRANRATWEAELGVVANALEGPIIPRIDHQSPISFDMTPVELPDISPLSFTASQTGLQAATVGEQTLDEQVASQLGIAVGQLSTYVETKPINDPGPQFLRLDPDLNEDGLPDNSATAYFERMPFSSPNFTDWYYRPVYRNMVFRNIEIPMGNNGLFVNCTFVGVTWVRTTTNNTHVNWTLYNRMTMDTVSGRPTPVVQRIVNTGTGQLPIDVLPASALPPNQNLLLPADALADALDKADFLIDERPVNFPDLPDPLVINGQRVTDTRLYSNNLRFHDCLFIGSITSDAPTNYTHPRNKTQFTGATKFVSEHPNPALAALAQYKPNSEDLAEIAKSSMMLPQYSVDIGTFNSPPDQDIRLKGAIIAGIMDMRGNASVDGSLILTFRPVSGLAPLVDILGNPIGNPAQFNATLGYFGPADGDEESLDPLLLPLLGGIKIVGFDIDGDGLADTGPFVAQPPGSVPVPFYGYGRIELRTDPDMILPDGIMMPLQADWQIGTYSEGQL
jgi:Tfp pilus assembly protein PilX